MAKRKRLSFEATLGPDAPAPRPGLGSVSDTEKGFSATPSVPIAGVARDASASAALAEVARTLTEARETGRMVLSIPLTQIQLDYLVRDRLAPAPHSDDADMAALKASLLARGQQMPIEVAPLGADRYGLISGWRRCQALAALHHETGDARFAEALALLRQPTESSQAYQAMVEENEIRVGLSYFERARIVARSVEQGVFADKRAALQALFGSASKAKRSKIGTFIPIVAALDGHLRFPTAISERQGLVLGRALDGDPDLAPRLIARLNGGAPADGEAECALLAAALEAETAPHAGAGPTQTPSPKTPPAPEPLCPGLAMRRNADGSLTLSGPRVTPALITRLRDWLAQDPA